MTTPPHDKSLERDIIGVMLDPAYRFYDDVFGSLTEDAFYEQEIRDIFGVMRDLYEKNETINFNTVKLHLGNQDVDLVGYTDAGQLPSHTGSWIRSLKAYQIRRDVLKLCQKQARQALLEPDAAALLGEMNEELNAIVDKGLDKKYIPIDQLMTDIYSKYERLEQGEKEDVGMNTGFVDLPWTLMPGRMIVIGGRPSHGKSSFALNIMTHCATHTTEKVLYISLEETENQLAERLVARMASVSKDGGINKEELGKVKSATSQLSKTGIILRNLPTMNILQLKALVRRLYRREGLKLVVIDYIQLLDGLPGTKADDNDNRRVSQISRGIKSLALELDLCIIAVSQLSRKREDKTEKRPTLSTLRESGAIEQDADIVAMVYRDDLYKKPEDIPDGMAEIATLKNRDGKLGIVHLQFRGEYFRFESPSHAEPEDIRDTIDPDEELPF